MSEYMTYTIVVRTDDDVIGQALRHTADGICFLHAQEGVTAHAVAVGAEPTSWDEPLSDICERIYDNAGMTGVFDYVRQHRPDIPWTTCEGCDTETPHAHIAQTGEDECLVCGLCKEVA